MTVAIIKVAMGFAVMAFSVAIGSALLSGVDIGVAIYRAGLAAGVFAVVGGLFSALLAMFFSDD
ncbi:MAG: hypothetical protein V3V62_10065 [bacterium]